MRLALCLVPLLALAVLWPRPATPCTTVQIKTADGQVFVGKGYDWDVGVGHVLYNKKGVGKRAVLTDPKEKPAQWRSEHASLTFNQYGREMPNGGVNDAGLLVEVMWLQETVPPQPDERPAVSELQWIQVQLDRYATVDEVVRHAADLRVSATYGKVHYLTCDRSGACAVVEFVKGKLVVTQGAAMRVNTLTNSTYADSIKELRTYVGFGGKKAIPGGTASRVRFARASELAKEASSEAPVPRVYSILEAVRMPENPRGHTTQWQIVYDLQKLRVSWRTTVDREIKSAALADAAPTCATPVTFVDINGVKGSKFKRWTAADNKALITTATTKIQSAFPPGALDKLAGYPAQLPCTLGRPR
jgi:penicillin V acylase-like amidase (Ntn superfamily)